MTREEFDLGLNRETVNCLAGDRGKYDGLAGLARAYKRPDIEALLQQVVSTLDLAMMEALKLGVTSVNMETAS